jgi:hypothetical protein
LLDPTPFELSGALALDPRQGRPRARAQLRRPLPPGTLKTLGQRLEQHVVIEPALARGSKGLVIRLLRIDIRQLAAVEQRAVSGEIRACPVRRAAAAGWSQRQHLPD